MASHRLSVTVAGLLRGKEKFFLPPAVVYKVNFPLEKARYASYCG